MLACTTFYNIGNSDKNIYQFAICPILSKVSRVTNDNQWRRKLCQTVSKTSIGRKKEEQITNEVAEFFSIKRKQNSQIGYC